MKLSYAQLVTLASIVEREAQATQERPVIAGVFVNRLKKHMYLESCATVEYALGSWRPHLTYKDLDVQSPYNTYRHGGLPPGPICNPGAARSRRPLIQPKRTCCFCRRMDRARIGFHGTYKEHLDVQRKRAGERAASSTRGDFKLKVFSYVVPGLLLTACCSLVAQAGSPGGKPSAHRRHHRRRRVCSRKGPGVDRAHEGLPLEPGDHISDGRRRACGAPDERKCVMDLRARNGGGDRAYRVNAGSFKSLSVRSWASGFCPRRRRYAALGI